LFMRSSSFWFTTLAVVVLHWAALNNLPWSQAAAATPETAFFQTRTITPQPLQPQVAAASMRTAKSAEQPAAAASAPASTTKAAPTTPQHKKLRSTTAAKASELDIATWASQTQPNDASVNKSSPAEMASSLESNASNALPPDVAEIHAADASAPDLAAAPADKDTAVVVADATPASPAGFTPAKTNEPDAVDAQHGTGVELLKPGSDSNRAKQKPLEAQWPAPVPH
jgi:hypothetical protein